MQYFISLRRVMQGNEMVLSKISCFVEFTFDVKFLM
jgi:hypothetical protein